MFIIQRKIDFKDILLNKNNTNDDKLEQFESKDIYVYGCNLFYFYFIKKKTFMKFYIIFFFLQTLMFPLN